MKENKNANQGVVITTPMMLTIINPGAIIVSALGPALLGVVLALEAKGSLSVLYSIMVVMIPLLLNASVNLLNDYYDYIRGNDTKENITDEMDAPLAFHEIDNPKPVLSAGLFCLITAIVFGLIVLYCVGTAPLLVGLIGVLAVLAYSAGKLPISHLPLGEAVAGFVMGGLIPLGVYSALTGEIDYLILYKGIPFMIVVALLMTMNNTCDIERDKESGRKTLPIILGRDKINKICKVVTVFWVVQLLHVSVQWYPLGIAAIIIQLILCRKFYLGVYHSKRTSESKNQDALPVALIGMIMGVLYPLSVVLQLIFG